MSVAAEATEADEPESTGSGMRTGAVHVAAWGFAFLLLRIFAVSGYDWDTAFLVSTTLGLDDGLALLFGSLMANYLLTAVLLICVLPLLIAASVWERPQHRQAMLLLATLGIVALVALTGSYGLWWLPAVTACGGSRQSPSSCSRPSSSSAGSEGKPATMTAYVLSVDSGYLNVITVDQKFAIILTKDVLARE